jgi:hypothetical protein
MGSALLLLRQFHKGGVEVTQEGSAPSPKHGLDLRSTGRRQMSWPLTPCQMERTSWALRGCRLLAGGTERSQDP